jgi:glycosyltransferase involved in cell wall biosynthesis
LKVLLIAEAANPEWTSVPLIGWCQAQALGRLTEAHIVTQIRNREAFLRAGLAEGRDFTAIDNEYIAKPLYKLSSLLRGGEGVGWTTLAAFSSLAYYAFEFEVWRKFGAPLREGAFDLVHRITPVSPTSQSLLAKRLFRAGVPFVIGPLNGGVPWPKGFVTRQHAEKEWLSHVRRAYALMPYYGATRRFATALLVGSKHTCAQMPSWARPKCIYLPENGIDPDRFGKVRDRRAGVPLKAVFVGRLVPYKGADILISAARRFLAEGRLTVDIVGDGPQRPTVEAMVDTMGLRQSVTFHGWVRHQDVQNIVVDCDFLALPSVREFGGGVVLEAMALGVTPVVANYAGPSELVDDDTGIRVPFGDPASLVSGFEHAIESLMQSPERLDAFGAAAREKAMRNFTWDAKAARIVALYESLLAKADVVSAGR